MKIADRSTSPAIVRYPLAMLLLFLIPIATACGQKESAETQSGTVHIETVADGLDHPWGMAFMPDGRLLVTERSGALRILNKDATLSTPVPGVPEVFAQGQGGLLDVALDPGFESNKTIYLSFSEPGENHIASTALGRGILENNQLQNFTVIFRQEPKVSGSNHFGGRIVFHKGKIFLTLGERFQFEPAQDLSNTFGTIVRINPDGSVPADNPFTGEQNAENTTWSYGHRNIEAAAIDPATDLFWIAEMGPRGGDELNQVEPGENYGWPVVSWGENYDGTDIPDPPTHPEFTDAVIHWTPVISPSGMEFYTADMFPEWKGKMMIGGLSAKGIVIVEVNGNKATETERIDLGARTRDVQQAPDGSVYILTDQGNGKILRLSSKTE